ncbi:MAG: histidine--tRNA ligase [Promethearchaeota archaeon]|nr:MAG: histidine--tRNA ligase [Candidatus Lokiarchaeota archaeon]
MSKKFSRLPLKGMEDFFPSDIREINWIIEQIIDIVELYNYEEYLGPLLEPIEIYAAKSSEELVYEQSYYIEDKKGRKFILRPEITPTLARMIARKSQELKKPIRWYAIPTCYRYEAPQKGRRREFLQFNADILGEDSLYAELEIFSISVDIFTSFGATADQFQIFYNNRRFIDDICELILEIPKDKMPLVFKILDKSDKMEESEFEKYVIDSFQDEFIVQGILKLKESNGIQELLDKFDEIPEKFYDSEGYKDIKSLEVLINETGLSEFCTFSSSVVRGLDYYTGTVFEVYDTGKENIRAIFGGGRYDDLLSLFSEEQLSGIGFGMGVLMFSLFLNTYNLIPDFVYERDFSDTVYITCVNESVAKYAIQLANIIRGEDFPCIIDYKFKSLKSQLSRASELGILIALIVGEKEMEQNEVSIKNMATNKQKTINSEDIIEEIYKILDELEEMESE